MGMIRITESQLRMILRENQKRHILNEELYNDLFEFLAQEPKKSTQASVQYVYSLNDQLRIPEGTKRMKGVKGAMSNPMWDKLFKHCYYKFNWAATYQRVAELKGIELNPDAVRRGEYEKIEGFDILLSGKNGLYLPVIPTGQSSKFAILEDSQFVEVPKEEAYSYLKPYKPSDKPTVPYRNLVVTLENEKYIVKISAGGNEWVNPEFTYNYIGPTSL